MVGRRGGGKALQRTRTTATTPPEPDHRQRNGCYESSVSQGLRACVSKKPQHSTARLV